MFKIMTFQKDKPMYTGGSITKDAITQEQFTRELSMRLEQLSLERNVHVTDEYSDSSFSPSFISRRKTDCTVHTNKSVPNVQTNLCKRSSIQQQNTIQMNSLLQNTKKYLAVHVQSDSSKLLDLQSSINESFEKKAFSGRLFSENDAEKYFPNNHKQNKPSVYGIPKQYKTSKSKPCNTCYQKVEQYTSTDIEYFEQKGEDVEIIEEDKHMVDEISNHSESDQEIECLDDDNLINDDNSITDISDSEASCVRRLSNLPEEVLPPVIASLFPNTPSVLRFVDNKRTVPKLPKPYRYRLLWRPSAITPNVVKRVLRRSNFRITLKSPEWIGYYGNHLKPFGFRSIREYQKVNHFPGSFQLGRKDKLWINLSQMLSRFGKKTIDFVPRTFCLPGDLKLLKEFWTRCETTNMTMSNTTGLNSRPRWIMKPPASARGIGIKLVRSWSDIPKQRRVIIQSYVNQPYLINGTKFDIRLYVYVAGFSPFRAYVYREGLVRFASQRYSTSIQQLRNRFVHLTNYSVNKYNKSEESFISNHKCLHTNTQLDDEVKTAVVKDMFNICGFQLPPDYRPSPSMSSKSTATSMSVNNGHHHQGKYANLNATDKGLFPQSTSSLCDQSRSFMLRNNNSNDGTSSKLSNKSATGSPSVCISQYRNSSASVIATMQKGYYPVNGLPPPSPSINNNAHLKRSISSLSTKITPNSTNCKNSPSQSNMSNSNWLLNSISNKIAIDPYIPKTDPRVWDISLSAEDKRKHLFYSSLLTDKEKNKATQISNRSSKSSEKNVNGKRDDRKDPMNILRHMLLELSPDDLRTLINLIDERYRAALGDFQCIFPVHGSEGYRMLKFLQAAYHVNTNGGTLSSRSPSVYYYDILQYAFLTVFHNTEDDENYSCDSFTHYNFENVLPDLTTLMSGELTPESMSIACSMTGVSTIGLNYLINLCKKGIHLITSEYFSRSNQFFWTQSDKISKPVNYSSHHSSTRLFNEIDNPFTLLTRKNDDSLNTSHENLNNSTNNSKTKENSVQTLSITPSYFREGINDEDRNQLHQEFHPLDKTQNLQSSKTSVLHQALFTKPNLQNIQPNRNTFIEPKVHKESQNSSDTKQCNTNDGNNDYVLNDIKKSKVAVKRSSSTSNILTNKHFTFSSSQANLTNSNEDVFSKTDGLFEYKIKKGTIMPTTVSYATRNTKSARYLTSSSISSETATKCCGQCILQQINSKYANDKLNETHKIIEHKQSDCSSLNESSRPSAYQHTRNSCFSPIDFDDQSVIVYTGREQEEMFNNQSKNHANLRLSSLNQYQSAKSAINVLPVRSYSQERRVVLEH
ncbi:unnamed protein product [Heterobilharzia americana]|nr:unnamed protein product [Heterobilharzia americana]